VGKGGNGEKGREREGMDLEKQIDRRTLLVRGGRAVVSRRGGFNSKKCGGHQQEESQTKEKKKKKKKNKCWPVNGFMSSGGCRAASKETENSYLLL